MPILLENLVLAAGLTTRLITFRRPEGSQPQYLPLIVERNSHMWRVRARQTDLDIERDTKGRTIVYSIAAPRHLYGIDPVSLLYHVAELPLEALDQPAALPVYTGELAVFAPWARVFVRGSAWRYITEDDTKNVHALVQQIAPDIEIDQVVLIATADQLRIKYDGGDEPWLVAHFGKRYGLWRMLDLSCCFGVKVDDISTVTDIFAYLRDERIDWPSADERSDAPHASP